MFAFPSSFACVSTLCLNIFLPSQLYPDYIYSIVRLLRPEHVIEQWQEQQTEAAERAAAAAAAQQQFSIPSHPGTEAQIAGAAAQAGAASASPAAEGPLLPTTATVKQPPGQVAQAKFALTSAFLEKVGGCCKAIAGCCALMKNCRMSCQHTCEVGVFSCPTHMTCCPFALSILQVIEQLVAVFRDAPLAVRATTFASVISALGRCMEVRR